MRKDAPHAAVVGFACELYSKFILNTPTYC